MLRAKSPAYKRASSRRARRIHPRHAQTHRHRGGPPGNVVLKEGGIPKVKRSEIDGLSRRQTEDKVDAAFLLRSLVKQEIGGKRCRVVLKSGDRTRTIQPDEIATFAEPLRDGDSVEITEL